MTYEKTRSGWRTGLAGLMATVALGGLTAQAIAASSGGVGAGGDTGEAGTTTSDGVFPVPSKHTYGDGIGAGRGHEGQDIMAKCDKKVLAAQTGRVELVDYHSAAGNYIVVAGKGDAPDLVYMHLIRRASAKEGEKVYAGEKIGRVGSTGSSTACHLHFEMWSPPGYYKGGSVMDPTPSLKRWDTSS